MSSTGMPSVMQTTRGIRASAASRSAPLANRAGTKITVQSAPVFAAASATVLKTGMPSTVSAALARGHPADDPGAVFPHGPRVKGPVSPGDPLDDDPRVLVR